MDSDSWQIETQRLKTRVDRLEAQLEQSRKREEQAAKLNARLLQALNQISQEEDRNVGCYMTQKQFVEQVEELVMRRVGVALQRMSRPVDSRTSTLEWDHSQQLTARECWQTKPITHQRTQKENRDNTNQKTINMDKSQLKSLTAKLLRVRNSRSPLKRRE